MAGHGSDPASSQAGRSASSCHYMMAVISLFLRAGLRKALANGLEMLMADLLHEVLDAHGGMENWSKLQRFTGHMSGGGPLFERVKQPAGVSDVTFEGSCHDQRISQWPIGPSGRRSEIKARIGDPAGCRRRTDGRAQRPCVRLPIGSRRRLGRSLTRLLRGLCDVELSDRTLHLDTGRRRKRGTRRDRNRRRTTASAAGSVPRRHDDPLAPRRPSTSPTPGSSCASTTHRR